MNTERERAFRMLSHREGSVQPMFDAAPIGPLSPSSSLLVERRDLESTSWQSHLLEDQLFHFFMKPAVIGFSLKDAAIAKIPIAPGQAVFCPPKEWQIKAPSKKNPVAFRSLAIDVVYKSRGVRGLSGRHGDGGHLTSR